MDEIEKYDPSVWLKKAQAELDDAKKTIDTLVVTNTNLKRNLKELNSNIDISQTNLDSLTKKQRDLVKKMQTLQVLKTSHTIITFLKDTLTTTTLALNKALQNQDQVVASATKSLRDKIVSVSQTLGTLDDVKKSLQDQIDNYKSAIASMQSKKDENEKNISQNTQDLISLQSKVDSLQVKFF